ncbi:MAG TPA: biosynthetic peptidoglycan transglycosylase, partial [Acidimicrobiales bacterium]|nr:biosynthetic peptidoglycan transglycosylase [Acidimicrobiales bacterium]
MFRSTFRAAACVLVCSVAAPVAVVVTVVGAFLLIPLPATLPEAHAVQGSIVSHVLDKDGNEIAVFREFEQNLPVQPQDIPLVLKQAVIASEDRNFYHHGGVDMRGSARALMADIRNESFVQGGSTITQQYVKNAYTGKQRTLVRKMRELVLASQLDRRTPKDQILFKYLESIYLGEGAYGVGAASQTYFRHRVNTLSLSEAALLAGIIPAPSRYEPRGSPQAAESRREAVLAKMLQQRYINDQQYATAIQQRVTSAANAKPGVPLTGIFPAQQESTKYPYFVDYVRRYLIAR